MFRTPLLRFFQTSKHFINVIPEAIKKPTSNLLTTGNMSRPSGLIANKGLELLTFGTPNGHKASIILEELKEAYGKDYVFQSISIMENIQKEKWFTVSHHEYSPYQRINAYTHGAWPGSRAQW